MFTGGYHYTQYTNSGHLILYINIRTDLQCNSILDLCFNKSKISLLYKQTDLGYFYKFNDSTIFDIFVL